MASWVIHLGEFFPEAVEMLMLFKDQLSLEHSRILMDIEEKEIIKKYPEASADLILLYLGCPKSFFWTDPAKSLWSEFKSSGLFDKKLKQVREAMYRRLAIDPEDL